MDHVTIRSAKGSEYKEKEMMTPLVLLIMLIFQLNSIILFFQKIRAYQTSGKAIHESDEKQCLSNSMLLC